MNVMLVWDDRCGVSAVRRLLGDELCAIMEICTENVEWLMQHGASDLSVGKWAGNSIPKSMASAPVVTVAQSLGSYRQLCEYAAWFGMPVIESRAPMVVRELSKIVLIPVSTQTQQAWLPDVTGCVWGAVRELWHS